MSALNAADLTVPLLGCNGTGSEHGVIVEKAAKDLTRIHGIRSVERYANRARCSKILQSIHVIRDCRGLSFAGNYAIATLSLPRDRSFSGLELDDELKRRDGEPWCGVQVVDLNTGDVVQWIRLTGAIREVFDVTALPGATAPMSIGGVDGAQAHISWDAEFGTLFPEGPGETSS